MSAIHLNALGLLCAAGHDPAAFAEALFAADGPRGVAASDACSPGRMLHIGRVEAALPALAHHPLPLRSRNNALLLAALAQIRDAVEAACERHGRARVAVVLGTSTSGIDGGERAMQAFQRTGSFPAEYHYAQQELGSPARFLACELGLGGPAYVVSTACSSGAKALASAARLIEMDLADAVLCGGVDTLCAFTIAGFASLESVSAERCNPMSVHRHGINIGEAAALFLMSRAPQGVRLAGWGESSDAHHFSAPDPSGRGARDAMQAALHRAGLDATALDYVHLHGTATPQNDAMEALAVHGLCGEGVAASSTKPLTGHTLGAAGALGAAVCWLTLQADNTSGRLPVHWWDGVRDPALAPLRLVAPGETLGRRPRHALCNAFAFGGNNASLVLSAE